MSEITRLNKDEFLFKAGETSEAMYILRSGKLSVVNGEAEVSTISPINMVGEMSFVDKIPRKFSIKATESSTLIVITREHFDEIFNDLPEWYLALYTSVLTRLKQMGVDDII